MDEEPTAWQMIVKANEWLLEQSKEIVDLRDRTEAQAKEIAELKAALRKARGEASRWTYAAMHPPLMWCQSCGTVSGDGECDCTKFDKSEKRNALPYEKALTDMIRPCWERADKLEAAMWEIGASDDGISGERARAALKQD